MSWQAVDRRSIIKLAGRVWRIRLKSTQHTHRSTNTDAYIRVEPQLAHVTWDDLFLLGYQSNAKGVVDDGLLHRVHLQETHRGQRSPACSGLAERRWQSDADRVMGLFITCQSALPAATTACHCYCPSHTHTPDRHTVLKFGKRPTGDVVSTGNVRNGFIITEGPVAPIRPGNAPPTAPHPPPGNRETESLNDWCLITELMTLLLILSAL